jgi:hypothetical protein
MGLAHFKLEEFAAAVRMWRMAVDQTPLDEAAARMAIMRNIGVAQMRMQQFQACAGAQCWVAGKHIVTGFGYGPLPASRGV